MSGKKRTVKSVDSDRVLAFFNDDFDGELRVICRLTESRVKRFQGKVKDILTVDGRVYLKIVSEVIKVKGRNISGSNYDQYRDKPGRGVVIIPLSLAESMYTVKVFTRERVQQAQTILVKPPQPDQAIHVEEEPIIDNDVKDSSDDDGEVGPETEG